MVCTCQEWDVNIKKINSFIELSYVRSKKDYDGVPFRYCPWCGQSLALKVFKDTRDNFHPYECGGN